MKSNYAACLAFTLKYEGGYSSIKSDPGNWTGGKVGSGTLKGTKYGISAAAYPNLDIKNLTLDDVKPIYAKNYWTPVKGDELPAGVDLAVFDAGVMSGSSRGAKWLQAALGVSQDGAIGPKTLAALKGKDPRTIIKAVCAKRTGFVQSLKTFVTFGKGWVSRITANEAESLRMHLSANAEDTKSVLVTEATQASKTAKTQTSGAVAAGGAGAATGAGGNDAATFVISDQLAHWLTFGVVALAVGAFAYLLWRAHVNKSRSEALQTEAAKA